MPIFNYLAAKEEGNLSVGDLKINYLTKIIGVDDNIFFIINPRLAGPTVSVSVLASEMTK
jgi:hypothetical protein